jgi:hypothetical protein
VTPDAPPPPITPEAYDAVARAAGLDTAASPPWAEYLVDLRDRVAGLLVDIFGGTSGVGAIVTYVAVGLAIGLPLVVGWRVARAWRGRRQPARAEPLFAKPPVEAPSRAQLDAALQSGDARRAARLAWAVLMTERAPIASWSPARSDRELGTEPERALSALEALAWGAPDPSPDAVAQVVGDP